ncbi:hypothetical protein C4565_09635 [Candidatus Parcubacteria bacterium]|nr:MAG: hypothetical protein C4565_09635 [Candidatus Parcubacteria bacterium]
MIIKSDVDFSNFKRLSKAKGSLDPFCVLNKPGTGKIAIGVPQTHTGKDLLILVHLEPPIGHG